MVSSASNEKPNRLSLLLQFIAVSAIAGIVGAGLAIPSVGVASVGAKNAADIFNSLPAELEERPLAEQSKMLAADGSVIANFYWQNRKEVHIDDISQRMQDATVAVEDERFFEHGGVDLQGIFRALVHNTFSNSKQGGSTLTQQYVKNVLSENAHSQDDAEGVEAATESDGAAGYARKLREIKLATALEKKYPKIEILNRYLNINNYSGSPRVYGVEAAAHHYWGVKAKDLNIEQSALLAGVVKNPAAYNPERFPDRALERRNIVLGQMLKYDYISQEEYDKAVKTDLGLKIHNTPNGCAAAKDAAYFCDFVQRVIENDPVFGKTKEERANVLARGGLTVKTTLNRDMQKDADRTVKKRIPVGDPSGAGHSIVTVEPGTGKVLAMAQNRNYSVAEGKKNVDTQLNYNVDRKHNGASGFQVGSTWKPFVLAEWLREGKKLNTTVNATKREYSAGSWRYDGCPSVGGNWNPNNAGDGGGSSSMTALQATKKSVNTGYAAMGNQLNMCGIMKTAQALGLKYGNGEPLDEPQENWKKERNLYISTMPSSILGTTPVTPIDMASAYAVFASGGTYCKPSPIDSIKDAEGKDVKAPDPNCHEAIDPDVAKGVAYALSQTFNGGTTSRFRIGAPAGAKTGTTNFEVGHTWLLGFTSTLSTAVWAGDPDGVRDWRKNSKGAVRGRIYGGTIAGPSWQTYMNKAIKHTKGNKGFRAPGSMMGSSGGGGGRGGGSNSNGGGGGGGSNNAPAPKPKPKKPSNNGGGGGGGSNSNGGNNGGGDGGGVNTIGG